MNYTIGELMNAWRLAALNDWARCVVDEPGEVEHYFDAVGWAFWIVNGYSNSEKFAWCGIWAAAMGLQVGHYLDPGVPVVYPIALDFDVARHCFPSTHRLQSPHKWAAAGVKAPTILRPMNAHLGGALTLEALKPGMICTIGDGRDWGTHIVIVDQVNHAAGTVDTIEGNAHGELGDGTWGEGVIRRRGERARPFSEFRRAFLLDPVAHFDDLTREEP